MTFQEILEGIMRHRAMPIFNESLEVQRKINEIEWALQALAERCAELEGESNA